jgi:hypothetical protein
LGAFITSKTPNAPSEKRLFILERRFMEFGNVTSIPDLSHPVKRETPNTVNEYFSLDSEAKFTWNTDFKANYHLQEVCSFSDLYPGIFYTCSAGLILGNYNCIHYGCINLATGLAGLLRFKAGIIEACELTFSAIVLYKLDKNVRQYFLR